ncbi:MAG: cytochrome C biosynthesis protein, partial [Bacteroidia bacterium]|nr:cytochrome C biosynthesis protein [Bacteroidia bacterium]
MEPINKMNVRSIFVTPEPDSLIQVGSICEMQGLAFDGGDGIQKVELSEDNGKTWKEANLDPVLGKYSWRRWRYSWKANATGTYTFKIKATNTLGETQPEHHWNRSGYMRNEIEVLKLEVK